jgi:hypothetical protein
LTSRDGVLGHPDRDGQIVEQIVPKGNDTSDCSNRRFTETRDVQQLAVEEDGNIVDGDNPCLA